MKEGPRLCPDCGFKNGKNANFCGRCGRSIGPRKALNGVQRIGLFGIMGSVLILLFAFGSIGWAIAVAGFIFVGIAVYNLSKKLNCFSIFKDYVISLVAIAVGAAGAAAYFIYALTSPQVSSLINTIVSSNSVSIPASLQSSVIQNILIPFILALVILTAAFVISAIFLRRSFKAIAGKTGVKLFDTTAKVYLAGAALTIVFGLGLVVLFAAFVLQAVAFFNLGYRRR